MWPKPATPPWCSTPRVSCWCAGPTASRRPSPPPIPGPATSAAVSPLVTPPSPPGSLAPSAAVAPFPSFRSNAATRKSPGCSRPAPLPYLPLIAICFWAIWISNPAAPATSPPSTQPHPRATPGSSRAPTAVPICTHRRGRVPSPLIGGAAISPALKLPAAHVYWPPAPRASRNPTPSSPSNSPSRRATVSPTRPVRPSNFPDPSPRCGPPATPPPRSRAIFKPDAMRLTVWLPLAALSALTVCGAATRPRYGGTLRVEMRAAPSTLGPGAPDAAPFALLLFETLVRLDPAGAPQPCLALSWQHDPAFKRWQFNLRPGVRFHDGSPFTAAAAVASLQAALPGVTIAATAGDIITMRSSQPLPDLPLALSHNGLIFQRGPQGAPYGTGPFHLATFQPGRRATFAAIQDYWG